MTKSRPVILMGRNITRAGVVEGVTCTNPASGSYDRMKVKTISLSAITAPVVIQAYLIRIKELELEIGHAVTGDAAKQDLTIDIKNKSIPGVLTLELIEMTTIGAGPDAKRSISNIVENLIVSLELEKD